MPLRLDTSTLFHFIVRTDGSIVANHPFVRRWVAEKAIDSLAQQGIDVAVLRSASLYSSWKKVSPQRRALFQAMLDGAPFELRKQQLYCAMALAMPLKLARRVKVAAVCELDNADANYTALFEDRPFAPIFVSGLVPGLRPIGADYDQDTWFGEPSVWFTAFASETDFLMAKLAGLNVIHHTVMGETPSSSRSEPLQEPTL